MTRVVAVLAVAALASLWTGLGRTAPTAARAATAVASLTSRTFTGCSQACFLRDWATSRNNHVTVAFTGDVSAGDPRLVLEGERTGRVVTFSGPSVTTTPPAAAGGETIVSVSLPNSLEPDHYTGSLTVGGVPAAVDLQVRAGPFWPAVVLVVATLLGFGIDWVFDHLKWTRFGAKKRAVAKLLRTFEEKVHDVDARSLVKALVDASSGAYTPTKDAHLDALKAGIPALGECWGTRETALTEVDAFHGRNAEKLLPWVERIGAATNDVVGAVQAYHTSYDAELGVVRRTEWEFRTALAALRTVDELKLRAISPANASKPRAEFDAAVVAFDKALGSPEPGKPAPDLATLVAVVQRAFAALESTPAPAAAPESIDIAMNYDVLDVSGSGVTQPHVLAVGAAATVGSAKTTAVVTATFTSWLGTIASLSVMLFVLAAGFTTTYLGNATFGAAASDWVTLFLWGLAAYGGRKTITGLGSTT